MKTNQVSPMAFFISGRAYYPEVAYFENVILTVVVYYLVLVLTTRVTGKPQKYSPCNLAGIWPVVNSYITAFFPKLSIVPASILQMVGWFLSILQPMYLGTIINSCNFVQQKKGVCLPFLWNSWLIMIRVKIRETHNLKEKEYGILGHFFYTLVALFYHNKVRSNNASSEWDSSRCRSFLHYIVDSLYEFKNQKSEWTREITLCVFYTWLKKAWLKYAHLVFRVQSLYFAWLKNLDDEFSGGHAVKYCSAVLFENWPHIDF